MRGARTVYASARGNDRKLEPTTYGATWSPNFVFFVIVLTVSFLENSRTQLRRTLVHPGHEPVR